MECSIYNAKFSWFRAKGMEIEISWLIENRTFNEDEGGGEFVAETKILRKNNVLIYINAVVTSTAVSFTVNYLYHNLSTFQLQFRSVGGGQEGEERRGRRQK